MLRHAGVGGMLTFHVTCSRCWCSATLGWGGMLAFHVTCSRCWCYATLGWGGMLTFHVTCSRCWCYATLGWGGMLTFHVTCSRCWCYATLGWGDVSWLLVQLAKLLTQQRWQTKSAAREQAVRPLLFSPGSFIRQEVSRKQTMPWEVGIDVLLTPRVIFKKYCHKESRRWSFAT